MRYFLYFAHLFCLCYLILLSLRALLSWFPSLHSSPLTRFIQHYTDPYLHLFHRYMPFLRGKVLDLSFLVGLVLLTLLDQLITKILARM